MKANVQAVNTATVTAVALNFVLKSSPVIIQGIGDPVP